LCTTTGVPEPFSRTDPLTVTETIVVGKQFGSGATSRRRIGVQEKRRSEMELKTASRIVPNVQVRGPRAT
jgi:hypothetical protein